jgi:hypothetical protein
MNIARFGTILVGGGCVAAGVAVIYGGTGHAIGIGLEGIGGLMLEAVLALFGIGAALLSLARPSPVRGRAVRSSLAIFAAGVLALTASSVAGAASEFDSLESLPSVVLLLGGGLALMVGLAALAITVPIGLARNRAADGPL